MQARTEAVMRDTVAWIERAVIGLNLCPFAKAVHVKGQIHVAVTAAVEESEILDELERQAQALIALPAAQRDTTLLVVPGALHDFLDFNALVVRGERMLRKNRLEGVLQLASFHPQFEFAGSQAEDIANCTNRSPYPTLHLLREESVERAVQAFPEAAQVYERNIETLERLGHDGWCALRVGPSA